MRARIKAARNLAMAIVEEKHKTLLFWQTGYEGRRRMGLMGSQDEESMWYI